MTTESIDIIIAPYGVLDDLLGGPALTVAVPAPFRAETLIDALGQQFPGAASTLAQTAVADDDQLLARDSELCAGQTIALLPPVSGGQTAARRLTEAPLDPNALMAETATDAAGAVVLFGGTVRIENRDKHVTAIDYSAYLPLAESAICGIENEIIAESDIQACRIQHRIGRLGPGDASVYIAVRAGHREAAFTAGRQAIDTVKARVPIWKNEYFTDGTREYVPGTPLTADP